MSLRGNLLCLVNSNVWRMGWSGCTQGSMVLIETQTKDCFGKNWQVLGAGGLSHGA